MIEYFAYAKLGSGGDGVKSNPLKKWRTVAQVAKQCRVTPQAIRDAIKAKKIEAWPVGHHLLSNIDQISLFEKTRKREFRQIGEGKYRVGYAPVRGRRKASQQGSDGAEEPVLGHAKA